jgi:hypothetical protein
MLRTAKGCALIVRPVVRKEAEFTRHRLSLQAGQSRQATSCLPYAAGATRPRTSARAELARFDGHSPPSGGVGRDHRASTRVMPLPNRCSARNRCGGAL